LTLLRTEMIPNGDIKVPYHYFECNRCRKEIPEQFPRFRDSKEDYDLCWDCGFIEGRTTEEEYLRYSGVTLINARATVRDGKVVIWAGRREPWQMSNDDIRRTSRYRKWRTKVLERDNYTCQECGQEGGELHAHHIKPFAKYKKLRFEVSNGLTLCAECHRKIHSKK
jgi:5-methylcytosine-specific restriction endonuclease McrA